MKILEHCFRVYAETGAMEPLIRFYEDLQGIACQRRVKIPEAATQAARVGKCPHPCRGEGQHRRGQICRCDFLR
jgi:hypothetical protein